MILKKGEATKWVISVRCECHSGNYELTFTEGTSSSGVEKQELSLYFGSIVICLTRSSKGDITTGLSRKSSGTSGTSGWVLGKYRIGMVNLKRGDVRGCPCSYIHKVHVFIYSDIQMLQMYPCGGVFEKMMGIHKGALAAPSHNERRVVILTFRADAVLCE